MTDINKQKFLAELARLLTFMYEDDLKAAMSMYSRLFDDAADEQALLQFLVSPTRQAVFLARKYNSKERKLQVHAQSREYSDEDEESPDFVYAIDQLREEAAERQLISSSVLSDQISLFAEDSVRLSPAPEPTPAPESAPAPKLVPAPKPAPAPKSAATPAASKSEAAAYESEPAQLDEFLSDFPIEEDNRPPMVKSIMGEELEETEDVHHMTCGWQANESASTAEQSKAVLETRPNVLLLILYILFAIPLGLLAVIALLVPTLLLLALAAAVICLGAGALGASFGSFAVFADIMVVLGTAIGVLALGLLLLWTFVWMLGGAIPAVVQGIIRLGRKWCYKEVASI